MNKDRGTIKWTALMLPEHIQRLREWEEEMKYETKKELTEWELESLQETIQHAYKVKKPLTFTLFINNHFFQITGNINAIDNQKRQLLIESDTAVNLIHFDSIQAADDID